MSVFESRYKQDFIPLHVVYTASGVHPEAYAMGTGSSFPGSKGAGGMKLNTHL
jgi:hypothetical protein